jgi:hypothetical protein
MRHILLFSSLFIVLAAIMRPASAEYYTDYPSYLTPVIWIDGKNPNPKAAVHKHKVKALKGAKPYISFSGQPTSYKNARTNYHVDTYNPDLSTGDDNANAYPEMDIDR